MYRPILTEDPYHPPYRPKLEASPKPAVASPVNWMFVLGLSALFLVNGLTSLLAPSGFIALMKASVLTAWIPDYSQIVQLIALNDLGLGLLLLAYPRSRFIQVWAGLWLLAVALIRVTGLLG
jgi:hypothetical protein